MELLGLLGVLTLWGAIGLVPWAGAVVATRGRASLLGLPLAVAGAIGGGALVPALGQKDFLGFWLSLATAFVAGGAVSIGCAQRARRSGSSDPDNKAARV